MGGGIGGIIGGFIAMIIANSSGMNDTKIILFILIGIVCGKVSVSSYASGSSSRPFSISDLMGKISGAPSTKPTRHQHVNDGNIRLGNDAIRARLRKKLGREPTKEEINYEVFPLRKHGKRRQLYEKASRSSEDK